ERHFEVRTRGFGHQIRDVRCKPRLDVAAFETDGVEYYRPTRIDHGLPPASTVGASVCRSTYSESASNCFARPCSSTPSGSLKKEARCGWSPRSPWASAYATSRARSSTSGAASAESEPSHVNWSFISVSRNPLNRISSHAVFQSASAGV